MKIYGHRGAAGHKLENTIESLKYAQKIGVDKIEFDIRRTKDGVLVLSHDDNLKRTTKSSIKISELTYSELTEITLVDGHSKIASFNQALKACKNIPIIIEVKETGYENQTLEELKASGKTDVMLSSFKPAILTNFRLLNKNIPLAKNEFKDPFGAIHFARINNLQAVCFNYLLVNPLSYYLVKRYGLEMYVYTLNSPKLARFINRLYPSVNACTDYPDRIRKALSQKHGHKNPKY
jgi:glycerophosphoryl diester phosphodiesterase